MTFNFQDKLIFEKYTYFFLKQIEIFEKNHRNYFLLVVKFG